MATTSKLLPFGNAFIALQIIDPKSGKFTAEGQKWFTDAIKRIQDALNKFETFEGIIGLDATVEGRTGTVADALTHVDPVGVVLSPGLVPATDVAAGSVQLPAGALSNTLGSAALASAASFDPAGSAATAQANAEAFATAGDGTTLTAAEVFASNASNITLGTLATARLGGISGTVALAKITGLGADGSLTFTNGLITAKVDPT